LKTGVVPLARAKPYSATLAPTNVDDRLLTTFIVLLLIRFRWSVGRDTVRGTFSSVGKAAAWSTPTLILPDQLKYGLAKIDFGDA